MDPANPPAMEENHHQQEGVYRFLAIRERFEQARLPGMGGQWELPFPAMDMEMGSGDGTRSSGW